LHGKSQYWKSTGSKTGPHICIPSPKRNRGGRNAEFTLPAIKTSSSRGDHNRIKAKRDSGQKRNGQNVVRIPVNRSRPSRDITKNTPGGKVSGGNNVGSEIISGRTIKHEILPKPPRKPPVRPGMSCHRKRRIDSAETRYPKREKWKIPEKKKVYAWGMTRLTYIQEPKTWVSRVFNLTARREEEKKRKKPKAPRGISGRGRDTTR